MDEAMLWWWIMFFTAIGLFVDMVEKDTCATGTIRSNHIRIPKTLKDKNVNSKLPHDTLLWEMHSSHKARAER